MQHMDDRRVYARSAYTLVELSIVLVIIGLIAGGITIGKSVIQSARYSKTTNQLTQYVSAVQAFKTQYGGLPGDITNATNYWGTFAHNDCTTAVADDKVWPGTCNGNGDGIINPTISGWQSEHYRAIQQLALAGLLDGNYSGTQAGCCWGALGNNIYPASMSGLGLSVYQDEWTTTVNTVILGRVNTHWTSSAGLTPEEALRMDTKLDDGGAQTGKVLGMTGYYADDGNWTCNSGNTYTLTNKGADCVVRYVLP